ncbi:putative Similar to phytoene dehydrogenase [Sterolibacterium denitrificans]|uniref:Similar to phytoene dehydrogenase n=1 Tax=Sterolibacterium denitrificans TaxID=157592 RepID=A0A7Z7HQU3_9PROT|nr:NAD(P)/FAD-dependent oxidoreductase [Sterolibacterium denitrificans]SMB25069.1 putative Similar to phytoene dehydrogenase [Sterolibacterium denitrificans]
MKEQNYDVIVIGTGPGGASCATLLQKRGIRTLLLEKNEVLGGKMYSVDSDGYAYDLFPHGQVPIRGNAFEDIFAELGVSDEYVPALDIDDQREMITMAYRRKEWPEYRVLSQKQGLTDPTPFFELWGATPEECEQIMAVMVEIMTLPPEERAKLDDVTMDEWLAARQVRSGPLYSYLGFQANASLAEPIDLVAASEMILILQQMMIQGGGGQYKGGFALLTNVMLREFEKNGGTLVKGCRVEKILVDNGAVQGVTTAKGAFRAPVVVSSAGIHPTVLKLVGPEHFDKSYVNYVKRLVPGWAFTSIRYFLDKPVMKTGIYAVWSDESWLNLERFKQVKAGKLPDEITLFMVNHSFFDENAAPPGKQVLVSGTVCSSNPEAGEIEAVWEKMDQQMKKLFPEIWDAIERREYTGPREISQLTRDSVVTAGGGECVGLAQIVGQCGAMKPKSETPVRGLYLSGADAGAEGMGTHQSGLSGIRVTHMVEQYLDKLTKAL